MKPLRREKDLVIQELSDETVVYDQQSHKAHCLNRTAAFVWHHCDGQTSVAQLARRLREELGVPADEHLVWHALIRLDRARLLAERLPPPKAALRWSRRKLVKLGVAAVAIPAVMTILAPTAMAVFSHCGSTCTTASDCSTGCPTCTANRCCQPSNFPCLANISCCSGVCNGGSCT